MNIWSENTSCTTTHPSPSEI